MADMKWRPEDWARLGEVIRKSRDRQGYSRKRLSEMSGISEKSIQLTEEGRVPTRWPKTVDALAAALEWKPGLVKKVLDGYDPEVELTDTSSSSSERAGYDYDALFAVPNTQGDEAVSAEARKKKATASLASLPEEIQEALPYVMFFASNCVAHGAPEWLGRSFDNAVAALLKSLTGPDVHEVLTLGEGGLGWRLNPAGMPPRSVPLGQGGSHVETLIALAQMEIEKGPATPAKVRILQKALTAKHALNAYVLNRTPETQRAMLDTGYELNSELMQYHRDQGHWDEYEGDDPTDVHE
ncbi:multiprotein-bridging factor 1 family protein [Streptomyces griseosporeus]|uniref:helix-turn-helix domain-containing protein n=1 Tax=Streptomyces griseosporeus TaxID=1910 RepID=UPI0036F4B73B